MFRTQTTKPVVAFYQTFITRFWVESENRFVRRVSTKGMRTIDKLGIDKVLADMRAQGQKV